jgi:group I intron endonuclease
VFGYIYVLRNNKNGKLYVGQTIKEFSSRWSQHCRAALAQRNRTKLGAAIRKYGINTFELIHIKRVKHYFLNYLERRLILLLKTQEKKFGYNITPGGRAPIRVGIKHTEETKRKISLGGKGLKRSNLTKDRMKISRRGSGNALAKLNETQVCAIKLLRQFGMSQNKIAKLFCVNQSCISKIDRNLRWSHV